jgi:hypothetical protein
MLMYRTLLITVFSSFAFACTSLEAPIEDSESWKETWKERATNFADGASQGAGAVGESLTVAAKGVAKGFDDPDAEAWGGYPNEYPKRIQTHLYRFEGLPKNASLRFGRPMKGYMNQGLFQGGGIAWQGYLINVVVAIPSRFEGQQKEVTYTVRMRDGEVIEIHDAKYTSALQRVAEGEGTGPEAIADATP